MGSAAGDALTIRRVAAILVAALLLTLASSLVEGTRLEVQDWDCPPAPASCARPVLVVGYPLNYISDYHGISPVGSAYLIGALLGEDKFRAAPFWANVAIYALVLAAIELVRGRIARRKRAHAR